MLVRPWILAWDRSRIPAWGLIAASALLGSAPAAQEPAPSAPPVTAADVPPAPPPPSKMDLQWETGDYLWKVGGYIKVDAIYDFDEIGSTDSFDPRTIPTTGADEPGNNARLHARSTRLNLDVSGPTSAGEFHGFIEGDFFSDQNGFRLRHAYGEIGPVLGGQTWSTFMDEDAMPETLDYESPIAFPIVRQAQIRYSQDFGDDGNYYALAIEDPDSDVFAPAGVDGEVEEPLPDLNARVRWNVERGHVQLSGFSGMARFDPETASAADAFLWGFNLSTKLSTWDQDNAIVQVTYGDGVGRYRGGTAAAPDADGDLEAIPVLGILASYQHHWSDEYRSTLAYAWGDADVPDGAPTTASEHLDYLAANLIWQFCDRAWTGIEYLYGANETVDDEEGSANRLQLSIRYDL